MPGGPGSSHGLAAHSLCGAGDLPSCLDLLLPFFSQARDSCPTGLFADLLGMGGGRFLSHPILGHLYYMGKGVRST